ncbi:hypothetical protein U725_02558 [Lactococcus cremoris subsp. cremoris GE214]|uniref:Uncharacterized protein n=1 Tax=Lactococcus cremoris subsp. cremoris GE214 TaxID=1415168 RepID=A0A084A7F0_LACLC|nr:hypothetical protein U725_02558 [Lactococcus cremoris subsp. cremoris GE214]
MIKSLYLAVGTFFVRYLNSSKLTPNASAILTTVSHLGFFVLRFLSWCNCWGLMPVILARRYSVMRCLSNSFLILSHILMTFLVLVVNCVYNSDIFKEKWSNLHDTNFAYSILRLFS